MRHLEDRPLISGRPDLHVPRFLAQPRPCTFRTRLVVQILRELLAHHHRIGFAITALEIRDDSFERMLTDLRAAALIDVRERNLFAFAAVQDRLRDLFRNFLEWLVQIKMVMRREALQHREVKLIATIPALDRAAAKAHVRKRDDALRIEILDDAEPVAFGASAHRIIEREESRLEFLQRVIAHRARELRREQVFLPLLLVLIGVRCHFDGDRAAVSLTQRRLVGFGKPLLEFRADLQPVDDDVDRMLRRLRELGRIVDLVHLAVDAQPHETLRAQFDEELVMLTLAVDNDR